MDETCQWCEAPISEEEMTGIQAGICFECRAHCDESGCGI